MPVGGDATLDPLQPLYHAVFIAPQCEDLHALRFGCEWFQEVLLVAGLATVHHKVQVPIWNVIPHSFPKPTPRQLYEALVIIHPKWWRSPLGPVVCLTGHFGVEEDANVLGLPRVFFMRRATELAHGSFHECNMQPMWVWRIRLLRDQGNLRRHILPGVCDDAVQHLTLGSILHSASFHTHGGRVDVCAWQVEHNVGLVNGGGVREGAGLSLNLDWFVLGCNLLLQCDKELDQTWHMQGIPW